jgi:hypothetical protein
MQKQPLQPRSYCAEAPPTPLPQIPDVDPLAVAARVAIDGEVMKVRLNARMDREELQLRIRELERDLIAARNTQNEERQQHGEEYKRLQSIIEDLKTRLTAKFYSQHSPFDTATATERKAEMLDAVRNGKLGTNAAAPASEIRAEAEKKLEAMGDTCLKKQ